MKCTGLSMVGMLFLLVSSTQAAALDQPIVGADVVFEETDGLVAVEAEFFFKQTNTDKRRWYRTSAKEAPKVGMDPDGPHVAQASNNAYIEILPDTRRTHDDKLIGGENFSNNPTPPMAVVHYRVHFRTAGRYYVWVRAHSTGSEDNGLHVGIDGTWPETGHRLQWCEGKQTWHWESKQRTEKVHCGEPYKIYLDVEAGLHEITFAMREDGFEFDKWLMTLEREFERPAHAGPAVRVMQGTVPPPFPQVAADPKPAPQPAAQGSLDMVHLMKAAEFPSAGTNYYVDNNWLAINPDQHKQAQTSKAFPFPSGRYDVVLFAVGENDGKSEYRIMKNDQGIGHFVNPLSTGMYAEGQAHNELWENVEIQQGDKITVLTKVGSKDGEEFSRGRWAALAFAPMGKGKALLPLTVNQASVPPAAPSSSAAGAPSPEASLQFSNARIRLPDGTGEVDISGVLRQWYKVTLTLDGPYAHELDTKPNPFTDYRMTVIFKHASGEPVVRVPGYFAADGQAAESSADCGLKWRAHLSPDKTGKWSYQVLFVQGPGVATSDAAGAAMVPYHGQSGTFRVRKARQKLPDLRAQGRLQVVGKHHLRFAGTGDYFLKAGADAPETLLGYEDFDGTYTLKTKLKTWEPHVKDWQEGDPTWQGGKGKGLLGALNYLSAKEVNAFSFLTYNAGGDGDNIWPFIKRDAKFHYDCSKLDQWGIVFDHAQTRGLYLHFKTQETENDDNQKGKQAPGLVPASLDGGDLGPERKLYYRELIARYAYLLALNWNLGEENTQSQSQRQAAAAYLDAQDAFNHNIVIHTFPNQQDQVYRPLLGENSKLTGVSLQNHWDATHKKTLQWVTESAAAGKPWVVANDEQGNAGQGVPPDPGYQGFEADKLGYDLHDVRKQTLWGNIMAGGAGVEYYFGYKLPENDLVCEDFRSRDRSWDFCRIALDFFHENKIPFQEMVNRNTLIGNPENGKEKYCLARDGEVYVVYLGYVPTAALDLSDAQGSFQVKWFNPRTGGALQNGAVRQVKGGVKVDLGQAPTDPGEDWVILVRK